MGLGRDKDHLWYKGGCCGPPFMLVLVVRVESNFFISHQVPRLCVDH